MPDFRFRVSDVTRVPLRGWLLRLKLLEGDFDPGRLRPGRPLRLVRPDGEARVVTIKDLSVTGGKQGPERVEACRELDVVIPPGDLSEDDALVAIGWRAEPAG